MEQGEVERGGAVSVLEIIPMAKRLAILVIAGALSACATVDRGMMSVSDAVSSADPVTGQRQVNLISEDQEIREAEELTQRILSEAKQKGIKVDSQTPYYDRASAIFERLKQVAHRKHLPWELHVLDTPDFNAFTIGGGKVFMFTGIFQHELGLKDDNEIAAVLAHEMAHVAARHASEKRGKLAAVKLLDKKLKKEKSFDASFTTIQEDEADRYSTIYMALAGYDPAAGAAVWERLHQRQGSYTGDMLFDHPLNDDRARNVTKYASAARQYYTPGSVNVDHEQILKRNALFAYETPSTAKAGEGGGFAALLSTVANTYKDAADARAEQRQREIKRLQQERVAAQRMQLGRLQVADASGGGRGLFGVAVNRATKAITQAIVVLEYRDGQAIVLKEEIQWPGMQPREQKEFGIPLKPIRYSTVSIRPVYVQLVGE